MTNTIDTEDSMDSPSPCSRPMRTITLVEQEGDHGRITWALIEGSDTLFGMDEANVLHAVAQQLARQQKRPTRSIQAISYEAFHSGLHTGRNIGAQEARSIAARERVEAEGVREQAAENLERKHARARAGQAAKKQAKGDNPKTKARSKAEPAKPKRKYVRRK